MKCNYKKRENEVRKRTEREGVKKMFVLFCAEVVGVDIEEVVENDIRR
jgi:hypothetical protein